MAEGKVLNFSGLRAQRKLAVPQRQRTQSNLAKSVLPWLGIQLGSDNSFHLWVSSSEKENVIDMPKHAHEKCTKKNL